MHPPCIMPLPFTIAIQTAEPERKIVSDHGRTSTKKEGNEEVEVEKILVSTAYPLSTRT